MTTAERLELTLEEKLERFAMLRDTISGLEVEKEELGAEIKAAMLEGAKPETDLYRARLQSTRKVTYPVDRFREVYGDAAAFEVVKVDNKRVKELVKSGDLDASHLEGIEQVEERQALYLASKSKSRSGEGES